MIVSMEMHIAAIVVANDARIVTNNLKELNRVSGLKTK
jgi:predicted nucleic acid-binding protein